MANVEKSGTMKYKDKSGNMTTMYPKTKVANVEGLSDALAAAKTFVVTVTTTDGVDWTADKTYTEIKAANDAGRDCVAHLLAYYMPLVEVAASKIVFACPAPLGRVDCAISNTNEIIFAQNSPTLQKSIDVTGLLKGSGKGSVSAAVADTDYVTPSGMNTAIQTAIQNTWEASY